MSVVLVNSPLFRDKKPNHDPDDFLPPIGLGYIASQLIENGISCSVIDAVAENLSVEEIIEKLRSITPDFVGLNIFSTNLQITKEIVENIEFMTTFVFGGNAVQFLYQELLKWKTDNEMIAVIGDGELIMVDIAKREVKQNAFYQSASRSVYRVDHASIYFPMDISSIKLDHSLFRNELICNKVYELKEASIITSRGCIYNCAFCGAARKLNKHSPVRERNIESIIEELDALEKHYEELESIRVLDDLFLKNANHVKKAIEIFSVRKLQWRSMAHSMSFVHCTQEDIVRLKESGCYELFIGIESGSEKILKLIHKPNQIERIESIFEKLFMAGINVKGYFIYGFPGEEIEDAEKTYSLAVRLSNMAKKYNVFFRSSVFQFRPYHGTELYNYLHEKKILVEEIEEDQKLSIEIGRSQFNFTSGNYSNIPNDQLNQYIKRTIDLNF